MIDLEILERNKHLKFRLKEQKVIEMLKKGDQKNALTYVMKELAPTIKEYPEFKSDYE